MGLTRPDTSRLPVVHVQGPRIWTIGHSRHDLPTVLDLLSSQAIEVVADVRSQPFSRFNPQFNRSRLRAGLEAAGIGYLSMGDELGGRPPEPFLYDARGKLRADLVARSARFGAGLDRLAEVAVRHRVAVMCSEEDPQRCHRHLLVGRALADLGWQVSHIRGNGVTEEGCPAPHPPEETLFGPDVGAR